VERRLVITGDIKDGVVTTSKIADGAVTNAKVADGTLAYGKLAENTIVVRVPLTSLGATTGLAADSTGVKAQSVKALFWSRHVKRLRLLSEVTSIPSDATVRIGVYNLTAGAYVFYRDYAGATGKNIDEYTGTMPSDDDELVIRVEVTAASATSGATFDVGDCVLQVEYGVS